MESPKVTTRTLEQKHFSPEVKLSDDAGVFKATIATLGVKDKDGDVTLKGFFGEQTVPILVGHDWGMVPIGKGKIFEEGDKGVLEAKLNLADANAKAAYEWLKFDFENGSPGQEFSYGYSLEKGGYKNGPFEGEEVRFLQPKADGSPGAKIHEASLVLVGAGEGTGTQAVKGQTFSEHVESVLAAVDEFTTRAKSLADLRAKEDRTLSVESLEKIRELRDELSGLVEEPEPDPDLPTLDQMDLILAQTEARMAGRI